MASQSTARFRKTTGPKNRGRGPGLCPPPTGDQIAGPTGESMTRREWMAAAAGTAALCLSSCSTERAVAPALVSVVKAPAYDQTIYDTMRRMLASHQLDIRGRKVVLKPNLVEFEPESSINTNPLVVHAALEAFRAMGAGSVQIAEGPGHRRNTMDLADAAGYRRIVPNFEDLFTDLNLDDVTRVYPTRQFSRVDKLYLPNTALGADLLVSMAKMKTHHWVGATLSMKNLFGVVPSGIYGWPKNVLHWAGIDESIADLHAAFPRHFAIVDGIVGMEGNGPIQGVPKHAGVLVAGRDPVAVDATCWIRSRLPTCGWRRKRKHT
ncbi:conserved hypothetical protein [Candidatus Sulfopaludibacter sp. SbA3]|nr:conserved hypothetical protein [Candidatus Sulfopaludibacter sp. SbA3]